MVNPLHTWYIVKESDERCHIVPDSTFSSSDQHKYIASWGPFISPQEAIAKRVGLIRAGKCQPM